MCWASHDFIFGKFITKVGSCSILSQKYVIKGKHGYNVCKYRPTYERRLSCYNSNQSRIHIDYQSSLMTENNEADEIIFDK